MGPPSEVTKSEVIQAHGPQVSILIILDSGFRRRLKAFDTEKSRTIRTRWKVWGHPLLENLVE
jgi:hypothetical protein